MRKAERDAVRGALDHRLSGLTADPQRIWKVIAASKEVGPVARKRLSLGAVCAIAMVMVLITVAVAANLNAPDRSVIVTVAAPDWLTIEDYNTNGMTLYIEEKLGVDLRITPYDSTDYVSKINLMIQSGERLEDILLVEPGNALLSEWAALGTLIPLTRYYDDPRLAVNIRESFTRVGYDWRGDMTLPDGEIYGIPTLNQSYGNEHGGGRVWIYRPWLDALGLGIPATTEELKAALEAAVSTDLNGNGLADELGLAGYGGVGGCWFNFLMDAFVPCVPYKDWMNVSDGTVYFAYTTPQWREGVEYIKSLFDEGLIPVENMIYDFTGYKGMINTEDVTCFSVAYTNTDGMADVDRKGEYYVVPPITGPEGFSSTTYNPSVPFTKLVITSYCENPEAAFRVGDLLVSEELSIVTRFGERGVDWDYISDLPDAEGYMNPYPAFPPYIVAYHDSEYWGSGAMQNKSWMERGPYIRQYGIAAGMAVKNGEAAEFDLRFAEGCNEYQNSPANPKEYISLLIYSAEEQEVVTDVISDLNTYVKETTAAWLTGAALLDDAAWDAFQAQVEALGASRWLEVAQAAYDRSIGR